jgi:hypothetical protein
MADSTQYTNINAVPKKLVNGNRLSGRIRIYHDSITFASTAQGDHNMMPLPAGAKVVGGKFVTANLGASTTALPKFDGSTNVTSAAVTTTAAKVTELASTAYITASSDVAVTITTVGTTTGAVDLYLYYVVE